MLFTHDKQKNENKNKNVMSVLHHGIW